MPLRTTNLNLVPVLRALLREASVSAAAKSIGLSQPATSHALARLRLLMGDPLLFRVGRSMHLTPRARRIADRLEEVCQTLEDLFEEPGFDPAHAERAFVVGAPDYLAYLLGGHLAERLPRIAPGVSIRFIDVPRPLAPNLTAGAVDLAIFRWTEGCDEGLSSLAGFGDRMVGVARRDHPLARGGRPSAAELATFPQLRQQRVSVPGAAIQTWPVVEGSISISLAQFVSTALLVVRSDSFAVVPKSIADQLITLVPISAFDLPDRSEAAFESCMLWGPVNDRDPPHVWFRGVIAEALRASAVA